MRQTGHRNLTTLRHYIRDGNLFRDTLPRPSDGCVAKRPDGSVSKPLPASNSFATLP